MLEEKLSIYFDCVQKLAVTKRYHTKSDDFGSMIAKRAHADDEVNQFLSEALHSPATANINGNPGNNYASINKLIN